MKELAEAREGRRAAERHREELVRQAKQMQNKTQNRRNHGMPYKCCTQNAEKVTHIKGRLLDQAVILFNCVPFQNGNFS